jgi:hypothetical protein
MSDPTTLYDPIDVKLGPASDLLIANGLIAECDAGHWHMTKPFEEWKLAVGIIFGKPKVTKIKGAGKRRR